MGFPLGGVIDGEPKYHLNAEITPHQYYIQRDYESKLVTLNKVTQPIVYIIVYETVYNLVNTKKNHPSAATPGRRYRTPPTHHDRGSLPFYGSTLPPKKQGGNMANCVKCKADLPEGARFCPFCGKKQTSVQRKRRKRANGTGCVYKMPGNRAKPWAAKKDGVFIDSFKTAVEAEKCLARYVDVDITEKFNLTFEQIYELWKPVHAREVTASQMACYTTGYKHSSALHKQKFRTLRKSDFQSVIIELERNGYAKSTCEKTIQLFSQLSDWALEEGLITRNHAKKVSTVAEQKRRGNPFNNAQIKQLQASSNDAALVVLMLIGCGARPNEPFTVPLTDCYDTYFISGSKPTSKGKEVPRRVMAVSPIGLKAYQKILYSAREKGGKKLMDGYEGNRIYKNFYKRDFKELMQELGITNKVPYDCRHTFSTLAVRNGITPNLLARMMGHTDIKTADKHYTHLDISDVLAEVTKITIP